MKAKVLVGGAVVVVIAGAVALGLTMFAGNAPEPAPTPIAAAPAPASPGATASALAAPPVSGSVQFFEAHGEPIALPDIPIQTPTGEEKSLADFAGKIVLVNFWATWCGPCRRELPSLEALQTKFANERFAVALVSHDRDGWPVINPFLDRLKIEAPERYLDVNQALGKGIGVNSLPVSLILGPDGRELGRVTGAAEWNTEEAFALIQFYLDNAIDSTS